MAWRVSTKFPPETPKELCGRLKLLLQEKQAANKSDIFDEEIVAKVDEILE